MPLEWGKTLGLCYFDHDERSCWGEVGVLQFDNQQVLSGVPGLQLLVLTQSGQRNRSVREMVRRGAQGSSTHMRSEDQPGRSDPKEELDNTGNELVNAGLCMQQCRLHSKVQRTVCFDEKVSSGPANPCLPLETGPLSNALSNHIFVLICGKPLRRDGTSICTIGRRQACRGFVERSAGKPVAPWHLFLSTFITQVHFLACL